MSEKFRSLSSNPVTRRKVGTWSSRAKKFVNILKFLFVFISVLLHTSPERS
jgi:hypothetical protein